MQDQALPRLVTARELSRETGIPRYRIYELSRTGKLPHVRIGRAVRFSRQAVREWVEAGGTEPTGRVMGD